MSQSHSTTQASSYMNCLSRSNAFLSIVHTTITNASRRKTFEVCKPTKSQRFIRSVTCHNVSHKYVTIATQKAER